MLRLLAVLGLTLILLLAACGGDDDDAAPTAPTAPNDATATEPTTPPTETEVTAPEVTDLLNGFLAARVAGEGAQQYLNVPEEDIPLLYATTSGAPYDRAEFERVLGTEWPYGFKAFKVRLFAGNTVVEQLVFTSTDGPRLEYQPDGFGTHTAPTTEDGQPVAMPYNTFDGEVTLQVAHPWFPYSNSIRLIPEGPGVRPTTDGGERNDWDHLVLTADPAPAGAGCKSGAGNVDAEALAESIRSVPALEATDPVTVSAGGAEALMMDVVIAAGAPMTVVLDGTGNICAREILNPLFDRNAVTSGYGSDGLVTGTATGNRMRLYLFDAPEGLSMRLLAIAIIAPESRFESVVEEAAPVVDSVEFHAP